MAQEGTIDMSKGRRAHIDVSNGWESVQGRVKWVGECVGTCQMYGRAYMDMSSGWRSVDGCVKWMGKCALT
jgi:hypothetical protein